MYRNALTLLACAGIVACGAARVPVTVHPADAVPDRLSDWGVVFAAGGTLQANAGVVPYVLNTPLYSDYALKQRTVWMPPGTAAAYRGDGPFRFPVGTILSKTFYYEKAPASAEAGLQAVLADREFLPPAGRVPLADYVLVETRLLVRYEDGWRAFPYVWNAAQDDAALALAGDVRRIAGQGAAGGMNFTYVVPDANQCAGCHVTNHASKALEPIGLKAWQLNRSTDAVAGRATQLEAWAAAGRLSGLPADPPRGADWFRPGEETTEALARAYLDANCAHCHNEAGAADTSALDLALGRPLDRRFGICKPPVAVGRGSGDRPYDIYPGRPESSILLYRMQETDPAIAMPELGRSTVHAEAVALLTRWIESLEGRC